MHLPARRVPAVLRPVPLTQGGSGSGFSAAAPPSAAGPQFPGDAQLGASCCARQPGEPASSHLLSPSSQNSEVKF